MWKWVIRDYFAAFSWENIKSSIWSKDNMWLWMGLTCVLSMLGRLSEKGTDIILLLCVCVLFIYGDVSWKVHPLKLPKMLYISPLKESIRAKYISRYCIFHILFDVFAGASIMVLLAASGRVDVITLGAMIMNMFHMTVALSGFRNVTLPTNSKTWIKTRATATMGTLEIVSYFITVMSYIGMVELCEEAVTDWRVGCFFVGLSLLVQLPISVILLKNWREMVAKAVSYEKSYL